MDQLVFQHLQNHIENTMIMGENCANKIAEASEKVTQALLSGKSIYSCGFAETAILSQLFVHYLTSGYQIERPGFPAIDLGCLANTNKNNQNLSESLHIHGKNGDILVVFSSGGNNPLLSNTIDAAVQKGLLILFISAIDDGLLTEKLGPQDIQISCADFGNESITAMNFLIIQCLCTLIDNKIFGGT